MNLASIIEPHPGDAVAIISRRKSTTYEQLRDQVARYRGGLAGLGLRPGDRVGLACGNNWYFVVSYLATLGAGMVAVPLNPLAPAPELQDALARVEARALVVGPSAQEGVAGLDPAALPHLEHLIVASGVDLPGHLGGGSPEAGSLGAGSLGAGQVRAIDEMVQAEPAPLVDRADDDLAALLFTSGIAGSARAAMLTHGNLRANLDQIQGHAGAHQGPDDVVFGVLPFFHIYGLNVVLGLSLRTGSRVVLIERFDPQSGVEAIDAHGVTVIGGSPPLWRAWADLPDVGADAFATVRIAGSGAAKLPIEVAERIEERFGLHLVEGYGLTEASPVVSTSGGSGAPFGSVGTPVPGLQVRLVDDGGEDVLVGDTGEVWVAGPNVFAGYWNDPEATATVLRDGWLHTGDLGVVDDNGYLYIVDRKKDLIIVSGFNVFPAEVEEVLARHPAVEAVAVVGVPHPYTGEAVKAYLVPKPEMGVEEDEIIAWCSHHLARYKCPTKIFFVDELPVGIGGKLLRRELRTA